MARPYWNGQIRISLVSFAVSLNTATKRGSQIPLHELDSKSGQRIHHRNVNESGAEVEREQIVKGFEADKDDYVIIDQDEIDAIKLPSSDTLELTTFVDIASIPVMRFERPYYVLPADKGARDIYAVIHRVLLAAKKAGIGQLTMRGREELCAILPIENGLVLETLRYNAELENSHDFFPDPPKKLKDDYVDLAEQLIRKNSATPHFDTYHDHYHEALLELINAKKAHRKPRLPKAEKAPAKVIDFADALRKSLGVTSKPSRTKVAATNKRKRA